MGQYAARRALDRLEHEIATREIEQARSNVAQARGFRRAILVAALIALCATVFYVAQAMYHRVPNDAVFSPIIESIESGHATHLGDAGLYIEFDAMLEDAEHFRDSGMSVFPRWVADVCGSDGSCVSVPITIKEFLSDGRATLTALVPSDAPVAREGSAVVVVDARAPDGAATDPVPIDVTKGQMP